MSVSKYENTGIILGRERVDENALFGHLTRLPASTLVLFGE